MVYAYVPAHADDPQRTLADLYANVYALQRTVRALADEHGDLSFEHPDVRKLVEGLTIALDAVFTLEHRNDRNPAFTGVDSLDGYRPILTSVDDALDLF